MGLTVNIVFIEQKPLQCFPHAGFVLNSRVRSPKPVSDSQPVGRVPPLAVEKHFHTGCLRASENTL